VEKKMKLAICSDLHLEFAPLELTNPGGVDVLILSGDILVERDLDMWDQRQVDLGFMRNKSKMLHEFMQKCSEEFPHVVYVAGNHEHYHGDFALTLHELKRKLDYLKNVHVLDKEIFELNDVVFVGGTLWTDMNKEDELTLYHMRSAMNDFRIVANGNRKVTYRAQVVNDKPVGMTDEDWLALPDDQRYRTEFKERDAKFCAEDAVVEHRKMLDYIRLIYDGMSPWKQMVVVGHHAPSKLSTHEKYKHDHLMNGGYSSDLSEFILDRPGIKLWTHGHTHEVFDYMLGDTRIVCNPRGYKGYEQRAEEFKLKVVEL